MVVKNVIFNGLYKLSAILFPLLTVTYATRVLGPENYGYALGLLALSAFFYNLPSLPFGAFAVSELSRIEDKDKDKVADSFLGLGFGLSIICSFVFMIVLHFFTNYDDVYVLSLAFLTILCSSLSLEWYYQYKGEFQRLFIRTTIIRLVALLMIFTLVILPEDYIIYTLVLLLMLLAPNVYNLYFYVSSQGVNFKSIFCLALIRSYLPSLSRNAIVGLFISIYTLLPISIAAIYLTGEQFSFISLPDRIIKLIISLTASFSIVLLPKQVKLYSSSGDKANLYLQKVFDTTIALSVFIIFIVFFLADYFILLLAGLDFVDSGRFLRNLSPLLLLMPLNSILIYQFYYAQNELNYLLKATLIVAIISMVFIIPFINVFSSDGYVYSVLLIEFTLFSLLYVNAFSFANLLLLLTKVVVCVAVIFAVKYGVSQLTVEFNLENKVKLATSVITSSLVYFVFIAFYYFFMNSKSRALA